mgnify:CR=1 FL=1
MVHPLRKIVRVNPGLDNAVRSPYFTRTVDTVYEALLQQTGAFLDSPALSEITQRIGKADLDEDTEYLFTEADAREIRRAVEEHTEPLDSHLDEAVLLALFIWAYESGGQDFLTRHQIPVTFKLTNQEIIRGMEAYRDQLIVKLDETTKNFIADQIITGKQQGLGNEAIADAIRDKIPQTYEGRAENIVFTETSNMIGAAQQTTAVKNGASHKEWITVGDEAVDEDCLMNEGAGMIGINAAFPTGHQREPAHPRCRCTVEYTMMPTLGYYWAGG